MSNVRLPDNIYFVYFTKNNLKNINPCRFNTYNDAYEYAKKYDKNLFNTVITEYDRAVYIHNIDRQLHTYLLINKILRKIFLYSKKYNNYVVNNYNINIDRSISLSTCIYLYTNVFFNITAKIELDYYKKYTIKDNILKYFRSPYNTYINTSGKIFTTYKDKQNKRISELCDVRSSKDEFGNDTSTIMDYGVPFVKECSIKIETFFIDNHNGVSNNDLSYSVSSNSKDSTIPIVFNDIKLLLSKLDWYYARGFTSSDPSFINIIKSGRGKYVRPYPISYNNANDFLDDFLSDKNIY